MNILFTILVLCLVSTALGFAPSTRQVNTFAPDIPRLYFTNINGTVASLPYVSGTLSEEPLDISLDFVRQVVGGDVKHVVKSEYITKHNKVHHAYLRQLFNGYEIFNADLNINTWNKKVLSVGHSFYYGKLPETTGEKTAVEALVAFAKHIGIEVNEADLTVSIGATNAEQIIKGFPKVEEVKATRGYLIVENGQALESVWDLQVDLYDNWFDAQVSAVDLSVVALYDWVHDINTIEAYPVGVNDPDDGARKVEQIPAKRDSSPLGWNDQGEGRTFTDTRGNNVFAQENFAGGSAWINNGRPDGGKSLDFVFPLDLTKEPKLYIDAATTNLFYWNNIIHDIFYEYGFDEESGNFQENNFAKGGLGNDAVQANCQDGSGQNNANFATPADGQRPRMRMYTWNTASPARDGDLDSGIIIHEYAHGISNRLTGGPSNVNCLGTGESGGMGEGWGDFFATLLRQRPEYTGEMPFGMGPYSANSKFGIRKFPYTTDISVNPETYAYVNQAGYTGVHAKGEVWAGILWEAYWSMEAKNPFNGDWYLGEGANNQILRDVVDGMKLQPCRPNFVNARDAILQADQVNFKGANVCSLWKAFAKRGLGENAIGTGTGVTKVTESFDIPSTCK